MKVMKKILSGIMALTMAASMMSATALQAGAKTVSGGKHEFEMVAPTKMIIPGSNAKYGVSFVGLDDAEWKHMEKIDSEGGMMFVLTFFKDENNYLTFDITYNFGIFVSGGIKECSNGEVKWLTHSGEDTVVKATLTASDGSEAEGFTVLFDIDDAIGEKYKGCEYMQWHTFAFDTTLESFGSAQYATNSKKFADSEEEVESEVTEEVKSNDISTLEISKIKNQTYTGKNRKPAITIKDGDKTLEKGKDYTVSYKNCKKVGTATATIKGKGDYTGEKTIEYNIVPKKTSLKVTKSSDKKATFKWNKVSGAEKYEIYYSTDGGKKYKKLTTVSGSKTSYTSTKLNFKKYDYKFKIRSYGTSGETKCYSSYSSVKTVK